ncbi:MAG: Na+/H+ antiporter subunit A [Ancrocorticia sp.]|nr:Na+/H+ antiporter subunit A [Ancrocorticia sp.]MCI2003050.1 Na+/H+ antiporter subunit A [Ancrocorticia sp.]MCI2012022.1 Na+/H+ antiporter subunit A [Ancrocorticia sp.]MCI2029458.1 Na+/H+ antiporter subunit A [Ancrocorticia sp.]
MLALMPLYIFGALCAPAVMRRGRMGFAVLSLIPALAFLWFVLRLPEAFAGKVYTLALAWVPQLGLRFDIRVDGLATVMGLIVTGVGALVLIYSSRYFSATAPHLGRFGGVFVAFSGAMLGLVISDSTLIMYMFWELTTVFSFLLIGHYSDRVSSRRAARQAIMVTTAGGLAMLTGIVIVGEVEGGSYSLSGIVRAAQDGLLGPNQKGLLAVAIALILIGAFSKSALIPFHFWLPAAMAAPTPVSAYLHAAAMVKAGVYLIARLAPGFADMPIWRAMVLTAGIGTMVLGGYRALKQTDLKLVLAFGTVSQLGLITLLVGYGNAGVALAGLAMLCAHSLFKSALFLTVGVVDVAYGTRDLRELSGVGRAMPAVAVLAGLAAASMMGFPPFLGFVAKETALQDLMGAGASATVIWVAIAVGAVLTVAYSARFWWGAFMSKKGVAALEPERRSRVATAVIGILAVLGLVLGIFSAWWSPIIESYAATYPGHAGHLSVWHGFGAPLLVTAAVFACGFAVFAGLQRRGRAFAPFPLRAEEVYAAMTRGLENLSGIVTGATQSGSLPAYLSTMFVVTLAGIGITAHLGGVDAPSGVRAWDSWAQGATVVVTVIAAILGARARHRFKAVLLMGVTGYGVALIYELYGAPDLALTQVLSETMTLVVFVLVLRRLPPYFSNRPLKRSRGWRIALAILSGVMISGLAAVAAGARKADPISLLFPDSAYTFGYGHNVVNVTLVDIRAWDTLGETSVLVVCAIGIASLLFVRDSQGRTDRLRNVVGRAESALRVRLVTTTDGKRALEPVTHSEAKSVGPSRWLASVVKRGVASRPVILAVGTRLVFYSIVTVSLFFLFSGHNQPGGGFAGGLLAGIALALRYLAGGRFELGAALPLLPTQLMGGGLIIAVMAGLTPVLFGGVPLQTAVFDVNLSWLGTVHFATALVFDTGVYIAVVGLSLEILRSLGGEIDRHGEIEGLEKGDGLVLVPGEDTRRTARDSDEKRAALSAWERSSSD